MTRRSLFKAAAAAFAGSVLAKLPLTGALPAVVGRRPTWALLDDPDAPCPTAPPGNAWSRLHQMIWEEIKDYPHGKADLNDPVFNPIDLGPAK